MDQVALQAARDERINESGEMPPCPFCQQARVQRSDYVRCNPCGLNWLDGENLDRDPRIERYQKMLDDQRRNAKPKDTES